MTCPQKITVMILLLGLMVLCFFDKIAMAHGGSGGHCKGHAGIKDHPDKPEKAEQPASTPIPIPEPPASLKKI